jgi:primosomal replication protein N
MDFGVSSQLCLLPSYIGHVIYHHYPICKMVMDGSSKNNTVLSQVWWQMPVISALRRLRQENQELRPGTSGRAQVEHLTSKCKTLSSN